MKISWLAILLFYNSETNALPTTLRNCPNTIVLPSTLADTVPNKNSNTVGYASIGDALLEK